MADPVVNETVTSSEEGFFGTITTRGKRLIDLITDNPLEATAIFIAGAGTMRAVDTRSIKKAVGKVGYAEVRKALPLGGVPIVNASNG